MKGFDLALAFAFKKRDEKKQREKTPNAPRNEGLIGAAEVDHACPTLCRDPT
jgi:hypothetical protein